jgi:hypothetical protein
MKDTVRGFFAGLKKKNFTVEAVERVRSVGPNQAGGRGFYTIYRVAEAGTLRAEPSGGGTPQRSAASPE